MAAARQYWLLKTEPSSYSIQDLEQAPQQTTCWEGVRNYQARNYLRDQMRVGDRVLLYHSNAQPPAVVGTARIRRAGYPDYTAWATDSKYFDPKSDPDNPRWFMVDVQLDRIFDVPLGLDSLREVEALQEMELLRKGSRLSVQPVKKQEFDTVLKLARSAARKG